MNDKHTMQQSHAREDKLKVIYWYWNNSWNLYQNVVFDLNSKMDEG